MDDGRWIKEAASRKKYVTNGGFGGILEQIASGRSLVLIGKEIGFPATAFVAVANSNPKASLALQTAMEIRSALVNEETFGIMGELRVMITKEDELLESQDYANLAIHQEVNKGKRKTLAQIFEIARYQTERSEAEKASKRITENFGDLLEKMNEERAKKLALSSAQEEPHDPPEDDLSEGFVPVKSSNKPKPRRQW